MSSSTPKACVFFDRDGVVNRYPGPGKYVERIEDFHILPEFIDALRVARSKGYVAVIVTNQRGVHLGKTTPESLQAMHEHLERELAKENLGLADIMICAAGDDAHPHRKPNPGMLLDAARKHGLDLAASWMIGDSESDAQAGRRAGCKTILVGEHSAGAMADHVVKKIQDLPIFMEKTLPKVR